MNLPKGYQTVIPYLILKGCNEFIAFTKKVFDAKELSVHRKEDNEIMHAEIQIGGSTLMMGEASDQWSVQTAGLYINVENADESFQKALENGATVVMPLDNKEYGRTGGIKDPCGNTWWITEASSGN